MKRCGALIIFLCSWLVCGAGCGSAGGGNANTASAFRTSTIQRGDFERVLLLTGELEAVRSIAIKSPQTNLFQLRIQFMAEEGSIVRKGDPLLDFDNISLAEQVRELESRILDAETQIVSKRNELASALKDLEIELAQREYDHGWAKLEASVDPEVLSRKEYGERQLALTKATEELEETRRRIELTRERGGSELDVLTINRDKLERDMLSAQEGVERLSIKAPADGLVVYERRQGTTLRYQEGDSCWPGQGIVRLPDLSEMRVAFSVNEVDAPLLRVGEPVRITLDSFPGRELQGEIVQVPSMAVKRDEGSKVAVFKVLASLNETWVGEMKPGMSALGRVTIERRNDVPLVARDAVRFDGESYWLQERASDGTLEDVMRIDPVSRNPRFYMLSEEEYARLTSEPGKAGVDS